MHVTVHIFPNIHAVLRPDKVLVVEGAKQVLLQTLILQDVPSKSQNCRVSAAIISSPAILTECPNCDILSIFFELNQPKPRAQCSVGSHTQFPVLYFWGIHCTHFHECLCSYWRPRRSHDEIAFGGLTRHGFNHIQFIRRCHGN